MGSLMKPQFLVGKPVATENSLDNRLLDAATRPGQGKKGGKERTGGLRTVKAWRLLFLLLGIVFGTRITQELFASPASGSDSSLLQVHLKRFGLTFQELR